MSRLFSAALLAAALWATPAPGSVPAPAAAPPAAPAAFAVTTTGAGRPMILIPGLMSSGAVWDATVAHFSGRYECRVLTLAGFAGQAPLAARDPFLPRLRDEIVAYIRREKLERPILVGHSLGGFLALSVAAAAPDLVGPVVAVDGLPFLPALFDPAASAAASAGPAARLREVYGGLDGAGLAAQARMSLASMMKSPAGLDKAAAWAAISDPATVGQAIYEMMTTDLRGALGALRSPLLLVGAAGFARDAASRERLAAAYAAQVAAAPEKKVLMAEQALHFVMWDDPDFLAAAIDRFLDEGAAHD